jgi:hypothetical protein
MAVGIVTERDILVALTKKKDLKGLKEGCDVQEANNFS